MASVAMRASALATALGKIEEVVPITAEAEVDWPQGGESDTTVTWHWTIRDRCDGVAAEVLRALGPIPEWSIQRDVTTGGGIEIAVFAALEVAKMAERLLS